MCAVILSKHGSILAKHTSKIKHGGFTLIEMLVVIGIIAIVSSVAVPSFRKCYQDMKMKTTFEEIDILMNGFRSYYLIHNEFPKNGGTGQLEGTIAWAFPGYITDKKDNGEGQYTLKIVPYQGTGYDFENWLNYAGGINLFAFGLGIYGWNDQEKKNLLKKRYGAGSCYDNTVLFNEMNLKLIKNELEIYKNRYY